jgi:hypothetical protein
MMSEMRDSRTAAQSATVLTHTTHFISHFSFRQYPSLHDIALPSLNTGYRVPLRCNAPTGSHSSLCHLVRFRPTCREPCGCSESILYTGIILDSRPPAALPGPSRASINQSRQENIYRPSHPQQLPTPLRSGNEPHSWRGQVVVTFTFIHSSRTG